MCTLTWLKNESSYEVFFNRDELLTRLEELPPQVHQLGAVRFLAPIDPQGQGTWIGVNDRGITLCLANFYPINRVLGVQYKSRGLLLWSLLNCESLNEFVAQIKDKNLKDYLGFRIVGFALSENTCLIEFNGNDLTIKTNANDDYPVTSSSFQSQDVQNARIKYFKNTVGTLNQLTPAALDSYQTSTYPQLGPYSVCMKREDACTKSYSRIKVNRDKAIFDYQPYPWKELKPDSRMISLNIRT